MRFVSIGCQSLQFYTSKQCKFITVDTFRSRFSDLRFLTCKIKYCQVCESAIDLSLDDDQVQAVSFSHVIDGALRSNYLDGTEYQVDMCFQSRSKRQEKTVRILELVKIRGSGGGATRPFRGMGAWRKSFYQRQSVLTVLYTRILMIFYGFESKSNLSLYSSYYADARNEFVVSPFPRYSAEATQLPAQILKLWRTVCNTV